MTGNEALVLFIAGPVLAVVLAMLLRKTSALPVLLAALVGEALSLVAMRLWSRWVLRQITHGAGNRLVALHADVSLANRISALVILASLALAIGGLALLLRRFLRGTG